MWLLFRRNSGAGFEAELSPPSSVNFNNEWKYTSTPHTHVHGVIPDRHRGILSYHITFYRNTTGMSHLKITLLVITYIQFGLELSNVKNTNE
jgi:hypothetical protein